MVGGNAGAADGRDVESGERVLSDIDIEQKTNIATFYYIRGRNSPEDQKKHNTGPEYESLGILAGCNKLKLFSAIWLKGEDIDGFIEFAMRVKNARRKWEGGK